LQIWQMCVEPKSFLFFYNLWTIFWVLPVCNLLTSVIFMSGAICRHHVFSCMGLNCCNHCYKKLYFLRCYCSFLVPGF
jgi:hypothetical protein